MADGILSATVVLGILLSPAALNFTPKNLTSVKCQAWASPNLGFKHRCFPSSTTYDAEQGSCEISSD